MTLNRYAARRDGNESELIKEARKLGWHLTPTKHPCDFIGLFRGSWHPIEVKTPKGRLTASQEGWHKEVGERGGKILIWRTLSDVIASTNQKIR